MILIAINLIHQVAFKQLGVLGGINRVYSSQIVHRIIVQQIRIVRKFQNCVLQTVNIVCKRQHVKIIQKVHPACKI